jgi:hypothetical protein
MGIGLDTLNKLKVVEFDWINNDTHEIGMIAEEVEKVYPEAVWKENGIVMGLKPLPLIALLVKSIQELQEK